MSFILRSKNKKKKITKVKNGLCPLEKKHRLEYSSNSNETEDISNRHCPDLIK